jgi:hypothetical protein
MSFFENDFDYSEEVVTTTTSLQYRVRKKIIRPFIPKRNSYAVSRYI